MNHCKRINCCNNRNGQCIALVYASKVYAATCPFFKTHEQLEKQKQILIKKYKAIKGCEDVVHSIQHTKFKGDYLKTKMEVMKGEEEEWEDM